MILLSEVCARETDSKMLKTIDLLSIVSSFVGIHTQPHEASRYLLAFRVLKLRLFIKEVSSLEQEFSKLLSSLKAAWNILLPIAFLILLYSVVGMHCFGGNPSLIQA